MAVSDAVLQLPFAEPAFGQIFQLPVEPGSGVYGLEARDQEPVAEGHPWGSCLGTEDTGIYSS